MHVSFGILINWVTYGYWNEYKEVQLELAHHLDTYNDRLVTLNLPSLIYRRRRMDMIMMYKILHGLDGVPFDALFSYQNLPPH